MVLKAVRRLSEGQGHTVLWWREMQITAFYLHEVVQVEHWNSFTEGVDEQSPQPSHSHSEAPVQLPLWFPSLHPSSHPMPSQRTWNPKFSQALILRLPSRQLEPRGVGGNQLFVTVRCGTLPVVSRISMYTSSLTNTSSEASLSFLQSLWTSF